MTGEGYVIRVVWLLAGAAVLAAALMVMIFTARPQVVAPAASDRPPVAALVTSAMPASASPAATTPAVPPTGFTAVEFVTMVLTAAAVILAALAIVLALAGAVGYVQIKNAAEAAAVKRAEEILAKVPRVVEATRLQTGQEPDTGDEFMKAAKGSDGDV